MATTPKNIISGAKAIVRANGKILGYATGVSISETTLNGRVESLGFIDTREITPISRVVSASCNFIRIFKTSEENGLGPDEADDGALINSEGRDGGLQYNRTTNVDAHVRTMNALLLEEFDLEILDSVPISDDDARREATDMGDERADDRIIYTVVGCKPSSQSIVVDRGSLMGVQVTLDARYLVRHNPVDGV